MLIAALSDIHGRSEALKDISDDLSRADVITVSGDITHFGNDRSAQWIMEEIKDINQNALAVSGNCDYHEVDGYLKMSNMGLHLDLKEIMGVTFTGLNGSLPCPGPTPNEYSEEEFLAMLNISANKIDKDSPLVFISHQPPFGKKTAQLTSGKNVGSISIRGFIEKINPVLCITGHIHEARGDEIISNTKVVNPGSFGLKGHYAMIELNLEQTPPDITIKFLG